LSRSNLSQRSQVFAAEAAAAPKATVLRESPPLSTSRDWENWLFPRAHKGEAPFAAICRKFHRFNRRNARMAPLTLALYQPDIPQNAGTMLRTCACLGVAAAIIGPAGFPTSDRDFRRAGMDYLDHVTIDRHASFAAFQAWRATCSRAGEPRRLLLLSTRADVSYLDCAYQQGDVLLVGRESAGAPDEVHAAADLALRIPMRQGVRSLNVAVAAAMALGEALRQLRAV
jgi:tRNA (cytidine/uridine-2'-O-)-methyltransferase